MARATPYPVLLAILIFTVLFRNAAAEPLVHHDVSVVLYPEEGHIEVEDTIRLPAELTAKKDLSFVLHAGLAPTPVEPSAVVKRRRAPGQEGWLEQFTLQLPPGKDRITLRYSGPISRPLLPLDDDQTIGPVSAAGIYLSGASYWYPLFADERVSFTLRVRLPEGWRSISQGTRGSRETNPGSVLEQWSERKPQEDIELVAARLHEYQDDNGPVRAMTLLREPDRALAQRYLAATQQYVDLYNRLLGPYPYEKFALVENFWDSGFGMPSFTLLGPRIIRFPFIVFTSYPHEVLHNWWGNGVYVDHTGNWSEGLTAYLADHLMREQRGESADYRRTSLQRYTDYVTGERDFPLTEFLARHSEATQAVGYDKGMMFFHMLRRQLGDEMFLNGLRRFYRDNLFQRAGFSELRASFENVSGRNLEREFRQWTQQPGAPVLAVADARAVPTGGGYRLSAVLEQTQPGPVYLLDVPLAVQIEGQDQTWHTTVRMETKRLELNLELPARPWRLLVDPEFDLMRRLDRREVPPSLSRIFGAERVAIILPSAAAPQVRKAYEAIAQGWAANGAGVQLLWDNELEQLPQDQAVWLFGWDNRFRPHLAESLAPRHAALTDKGITLGDRALRRAEHGVIAVAHHPQYPDLPLAWLAYDRPQGLPGLARKIRHYGSYSYLAFAGGAPDNVLKGQWPVVDSPLWLKVAQPDGAPAPAPLPTFAPRQPLANMPQPTEAHPGPARP